MFGTFRECFLGHLKGVTYTVFIHFNISKAFSGLQYRTVFLQVLSLSLSLSLSLPPSLSLLLGLQPQHMEVPRLRGESLELQMLAHATGTAKLCWISATSATYTTAWGNTGSLTHWERPGIEPKSSWILVRFVTSEPQWELQHFSLSFSLVTILCTLPWP